MNRGLYRTVLGVTLAVVVAGGALSAFAPPVKRGPSIRFSDPKSETSATNLNTLAEEKKNNLRRLEEDLGRSFRMLDRDDAAGARRMLPRPPPGPIIQSRKVRELLDKEKNWVFESPENRQTGLTPEEMMNVPDLDAQGREKSSVPAFERYYDSMGRDGLGMTNRGSGSFGDSHAMQDALEARQDDSATPSDPVKARIKDAEQGLRQSVSEESGPKLLPALSDTSVMPNLFSSQTPKPVPVKGQEARLNQFRQMMQTDSTKPASRSFSGGTVVGGDSIGDRLGRVGGVVTKPAPVVNSPPSAAPGSAGLSRAGLAASPGLAGASGSSLEPVAPRRTPPPSLFPETPQRKF